MKKESRGGDFSSQTGDLADELARVESAGGKVLRPKREISPCP